MCFFHVDLVLSCCFVFCLVCILIVFVVFCLMYEEGILLLVLCVIASLYVISFIFTCGTCVERMCVFFLFVL